MKTQKNIVIVGAGFGGLFCAKKLSQSNIDANITLIDKENHHLFQPLLYQVASGFLGISDVALPVRSLFKRKNNINVVMDTIQGVNKDEGFVFSNKHEYPFDYLVIATGAKYHFFGNDEKWAKHCHVLKSLENAIGLRRQFLSSLEKAETETDPDVRKKLLTYTIIGGGPTGVETAGAFAQAVNHAVEDEFKNINHDDITINLIEGTPYILNVMPPKLSEHAKDVLEKQGVTVMTGTMVESIEAGVVKTNNGDIECDTILWAAGVKPRAVHKWLDIEPDRRGGVTVGDDLSIPEHENIFMIGDCATKIQGGNPLPALAPVAKQQGKYLAKLLQKRVKGEEFTQPFHYWDYGNMAVVGRNSAVSDFGMFTLKGWLGYVLWGLSHIYFLIGNRNRANVFITWLWTYLTFGVGSRILIHTNEAKDEDNT